MTSDQMLPEIAGVTPEQFRSAMGSVCTPVSVVTAFDGSRPHGTTVSAFCSLSMTPPMVLVALDENSALLGLLRTSQRFGVNVLSDTQPGIAGKFAVKGDDKFRDVAWSDRSGAPYIEGSAIWFVCEAEQYIRGGDHTVVLGRVLDTHHEDLAAPLTYHRSVFGTHAVAGPPPGTPA